MARDYPIPLPPPLVRPNHMIDLSMRTAVRRHIVTVLMHTDGHQAWAADELGINHSTLYRILRDWDRPARRINTRRSRDAESDLAGTEG